MARRTRWTWSVGAALVAAATAATLITNGVHTRSADAKGKGGGACVPGSSILLAAMPVEQHAFPPTGPTYPEGTAVLDHRIITSGPANFGTAGNGSPSQLTVFDRHSGNLLAEVPLQGELLQFEHALSELAAWKNYVFAPSTQLGVLRWKFEGNKIPQQESVSLPFCSVTGNFPCHQPSEKCPGNVRAGLPPLPNGIDVDDDGDVIVADSLQGILWRIPALRNKQGPAQPEVLFCSRTLQGFGEEGLSAFGANGVAIVGKHVYFSVTFGPPNANGLTGPVYRLPLENPTEQDLELVYRYDSFSPAPGVVVPPIPDGIRVNPRTGHLFVALAGYNQISELDIGTTPAVELGRFTRSDPDHPMQNPSTIAFSPDGHTGYVSNHAISCCLDNDPNPSCICSGAYNFFGVIELCLD